MKKAFLEWLRAFVGFACIYGSLSWIVWDTNAARWPIATRCVAVVATVVWGYLVGSYQAYQAKEKRKERDYLEEDRQLKYAWEKLAQMHRERRARENSNFPAKSNSNGNKENDAQGGVNGPGGTDGIV